MIGELGSWVPLFLTSFPFLSSSLSSFLSRSLDYRQRHRFRQRVQFQLKSPLFDRPPPCIHPSIHPPIQRRREQVKQMVVSPSCFLLRFHRPVLISLPHLSFPFSFLSLSPLFGLSKFYVRFRTPSPPGLGATACLLSLRQP